MVHARLRFVCFTLTQTGEKAADHQRPDEVLPRNGEARFHVLLLPDADAAGSCFWY